MTTSIRLTVLALSLAAGTAFAESPTIDDSQRAATFKSRAEVQAELQQFKKGPNPWSTSYNPLARMQEQTSRDDVRRDVLSAIAAHQLNALVGEDSGSLYLAQSGRSDGTAQLLAASAR